MQQKFAAEAQGITEKAEAMKLFDGVGREHEEFKLRLNKDKDIELAAIDGQTDIAEAQAEVVGDALKTARIDIVGGETEFFDKIVNSIKAGKAVDRWVHNSRSADRREEHVLQRRSRSTSAQNLKKFIDQFGLSTEDVKDLSIAALIGKMLMESDDDVTTSAARSDCNVSSRPAASWIARSRRWDWEWLPAVTRRTRFTT